MLISFGRYLVRFLVVAFERNDDVIKSFLQAREAHHIALLALKQFPKVTSTTKDRQRGNEWMRVSCVLRIIYRREFTPYNNRGPSYGAVQIRRLLRYQDEMWSHPSFSHSITPSTTASNFLAATHIKDAVWLARRRRELMLARRATDQAGRRIRGIFSAATRRIPFARRLFCLRKNRRRRKKKHSDFLGIGSDGDGDGFGVTEITSTVNLTVGKNDVDESQEEGSRNRLGLKSGKHDGNTVAASKIAQVAMPSCGERPATVQMRAGTGRPLSRAAAAAMAQSDAENAGIGRRRPDRRLQGATGSMAGLLRHYLERRSSACVGLQPALASERDACANARGEYVLALSDFESDHSLEITW